MKKNCIELWEDINNKTYNISKSITFIVTVPKYREVFAANFRDRIVHHIVMMRLEPLFEEIFISDTYNCRKNKGTLYGVKRLFEQVKEISENYTVDCYIGKFDMQGFFMSIHKPTLWKMLNLFINTYYKQPDKNILLWLVEKIVKHCPEKNCIKKSPDKMWKHIPPQKSLFTTGDDYGLPIGNLTSQVFANYYLHFFDVKMNSIFMGYGRYVDDFFIIEKNKEHIVSKIEYIKNFLHQEIGITLHPNKLYIQHYKKGCKFIGSVIKANRMYIGSYTVGRFYNKIRYFNNIKESDIEECTEYFVNCINSYLGFMKHYKSYSIRRNIINLISKKWFNTCYINKSFDKIVCKKEYKSNEKIKNLILLNNLY